MYRVLIVLVSIALAVASVPPAPPAPANFYVTFNTTVKTGNSLIVLNVTRSFAPHGVDRFYQLLQPAVNYYQANGFFRVVPNFVVQFGISGIPSVAKEWENADIPDDPVVISNLAGTIAYADAGPNTRTTQLFINYGNNTQLDGMGFAPFGRVIHGMDVALAIYSGYGQDPNQQQIYTKGDAYLKKSFPKLDYLLSTTVSLTPPPSVPVPRPAHH